MVGYNSGPERIGYISGPEGLGTIVDLKGWVQ